MTPYGPKREKSPQARCDNFSCDFRVVPGTTLGLKQVSANDICLRRKTLKERRESNMTALSVWILLWFVNGWGFPNALIRVPPYAVGYLQHGLHLAGRVTGSC